MSDETDETDKTDETFCGFLPVLSVCLITLGASRGYRDGYGRYATLGEEKGRQRPPSHREKRQSN